MITGIRSGSGDGVGPRGWFRRRQTGLGLLCVITLLVIVIGAFGDAGRALLRYDRIGLYGWELWRLVTGHLAHLNAGHGALNLAAMWLAAFAFGHLFSAWRWLAIGLGSMAAVDAGMWFLAREVTWFVGLSGILHGIVAAAAVALAARGRLEGWLLAVAIAGKLTWEQWQGAMPGTAELSGGPVIVDSHLFGSVGGVLAGLAVLVPAVRSRLQ